MTGMIAEWHADHANFAKLLALLEAQLELLGKAESPDYELMLDIMYYMTHYPDTVHPPMEDRIFAKLKKREAGTSSRVDVLVDQHAQLHKNGEALVQDLDDIVNGSIASRARIEASARRYVSDFREHMRVEEAEIIPLAVRHLLAEDWSSMGAAHRDVDDPLFGKREERRYATLRRHIAAHARGT